MDITPTLSRAARALIGISQEQLASTARVSKRTIAAFETGDAILPAMRDAICRALESQGVIFIAENGEGPGVRLKKTTQGEG